MWSGSCTWVQCIYDICILFFKANALLQHYIVVIAIVNGMYARQPTDRLMLKQNARSQSQCCKHRAINA